MIRECNSLDDLLRFCDYLSADARAEIRKAMATYTHQVLRYEWQALGDGRKDQHAEEFFTHLVNKWWEQPSRVNPNDAFTPGCSIWRRRPANTAMNAWPKV